MNRIKRYTEQVFAEHKADFGLDFAENRKVLRELATIRSKELQNEIAGYITRTLKREKHEIEERRRRAAADAAQEHASIDEPVIEETEEAAAGEDGKSLTDGMAVVKEADSEAAEAPAPEAAADALKADSPAAPDESS